MRDLYLQKCPQWALFKLEMPVRWPCRQKNSSHPTGLGTYIVLIVAPIIMEILSKPSYALIALALVFLLGMSSGLLWAKSGQDEEKGEIIPSVKASILPLSNGVFLGVAKDEEKLWYKSGNRNAVVDLSKKVNVFYVVDLSRHKVSHMDLGESMDSEKSLFLLSTPDHIYVFDKEGSRKASIERR